MRNALLKKLSMRRGRGVTGAAVAALVAGLAFSAGNGPAAAQESVIIGGRGLPAVVVNLEVLADLGSPVQPRRLRMPGQAGRDTGLIRLKPPPGVRARAITVRTPRTRPERSAFARAGPESPGRDPTIRLRQPGEARSSVTARSTRRAVPAVPTRPVERSVLPPPPTPKAKEKAPAPVRTARSAPARIAPERAAKPVAPAARARVTPPPAPTRRAVERAADRRNRSGARADLPALEQRAKPVEPPPLPPRVITRDEPPPPEPLQERRIARAVPEPAVRPQTPRRTAPPVPAPVVRKTEPTAVQDKPPASVTAAPTPIRQAPARPTVRAEPAPARPTVRAERAPPSVRPPPPRETQTAALPRARAPIGEQEALRVVFSGSSSRLAEEGEAGLRSLVQSIAETETRIQLKAFAAGSADRPSTARRLSLSRALAVRSFLIEQGMRSTRIDVRALGVPADDGPADRVDVILLTQ